MTYHITQITVDQPGSAWHGKTAELLLENGFVSAIGEKLNTPAGATVVDMKGTRVSAGWTDLRAYNGEPGYEYKETLDSLAAAACRGGFCRVTVLPETLPVGDNRSAISYVIKRSEQLPVHILPAGCLTKEMNGKEVAELFDMQSAGAVAFTDGDHSLPNAGVMSRSLEYASGVNALVMVQPFDPSLAPGGQMHEGPVSTAMGLKGIPEMAEQIMVQRDLELLRYNGGRLHFSCISTVGAVDLIRKAKAEGLNVSCDVAVYSLCFTDEDLKGFDTLLKVAPPLRDEANRNALLDGLLDGTIDAICSNHRPHDEESKKVEFHYAASGASTVQYVYVLLKTHTRLSDEIIAAKLGSGPARVLGLPDPAIESGACASLTFFDPEAQTAVQPSDDLSLSTMNYLFGKTLKGAVKGVYCKEVLHLF